MAKTLRGAIQEETAPMSSGPVRMQDGDNDVRFGMGQRRLVNESILPGFGECDRKNLDLLVRIIPFDVELDDSLEGGIREPNTWLQALKNFNVNGF